MTDLRVIPQGDINFAYPAPELEFIFTGLINQQFP